LRTLLLIALTLTAPVLRGQEPELKIPEDKDPVTTASGLTFSVLEAGTGTRHPKLHDKVRVHYTGWLASDGTIFDSSVRRGQPATFKLGEVVAGWNEGLTKITEGGRIKLTIPPDLAYGSQGRPGIPPDSTLIFEVHLLAMEPDYPEKNADSEVKTESGIVYEVLKEGEGKKPTIDDMVVINYAFWSPEKELLAASALESGKVTIPCAGTRLEFFKEVLPMMCPGAAWRLEVPAKLGLGPGKPDTVWHLELVSVVVPLPIPEFSIPDEKDLVTSGSGLQTQVIKKGTGPTPKMGQPVVCHYAGWLKKDGTLFDSSFKRAEPAEFQVGGLIPGWNEALMKMSAGGIVKLVIPAKLAYGERGSPPAIGPNEDLVFYMELIEIK
jgi:FKBP-type peptidyl-prolyl cis-trans isomerase